MPDLPVAVRVKRRRDCAAPAEIILETNSRPQDVLAASLQQTLAVTHNYVDATAAPEGPANKRCRFVLVPGRAAAAGSHAAAGVQEQQGLPGPVLELWHTSGLDTSTSAASDGAHASQAAAAAGRWRPQPASEESGEARADVYAAMVQQYMQEQQHSTPSGPQQQHNRHWPSKCVQPGSSSHTTSGATPAQQEQLLEQHKQQLQQERGLPTYMTKGMLKQYGLWQGQRAHQQDSTAAPAGLSTSAHSVGPHAPASTDDSMDVEYTYDVYVAAEADGSSAGALNPGAGASGSQQDGTDMWPSTPDIAGELPVIQVGGERSRRCIRGLGMPFGDIFTHAHAQR